MRRQILLTIGFLVAFSGPIEAAPPAKPPVKAPVQTSAGAIPLLKAGLAAYQNNQDAAAEKAFKQALTVMGPADSNRIVAVDALSHLYYRQSRMAEALTFTKQAIPLMVKRYGANSIQEADACFLIGGIQYKQKDNLSAETNYKRGLGIYEMPQNTNKMSANYSYALENLAIIEGQAKRYDQALAHYQKSLALRKQLPNENLGSLYENIGILYQNNEKEADAVRSYQQALEAYQKNAAGYGEAIQRVSFKLANMQGSSVQQADDGGEHYNGQYFEAAKKAFNEDRNFPEAAKQFQLALEQVKRFHPKEEKFINMLESNLGRALFHAQDMDAALPYLEKVYAFHSKQSKPDDEELVATQAYLGFAYNTKGDYEHANQYLQNAKAHTARQSDLYGSVLTSLADNLCHQGQFAQAKTLYDEALTFYNQKGAAGAEQIKGIQYQLSLLDKMFQSQQGIDELISYSKDGLRHWSKGSTPIYILMNSGTSLPEWKDQNLNLAKKAFQEWQTSLNGLVRFEFTTDPEKTDVIFNWTDRPIDVTDVDAKVGLHKLATIRSYYLSSEIIVSLRDNGKKRNDAEIYATALHEIGHLLGLQHSSNLADVMSAVGNYSVPASGWPALSAEDIEAAQALYRQTPAVTNPKGITLAEYRKFDKLVKPGIDAVKGHDYKQASRIFEDARLIYDEDTYINYFAGLSAFQAGDYKEAREIFESLPMPQSSPGFSVDSQLGLIYVELGHKYNKWGRKNKATSNEFYDKGVTHLRRALQDTEVTADQKPYLYEKLREGENRSRPEPVYTWQVSGPMSNMFGRF